jgi:regulatory protein YycI of two-component signal transduction system YycFG
MKLFLIILFFLSIIITIIGYYQSIGNKPNKIEYRFIDRNINEIQKQDNLSIYNTFQNMFKETPILG